MSKLTRPQVILKNATKDDLHEFGGQVAFAAHHGSRGHRQQYYSERCSLSTDKVISLDDAAELIRHIASPDRKPAMLEVLCTEAGGVFVPLPSLNGGTGPIAEGFAKLATEFGEVAGAIGQALADKRVYPEEARNCHVELQDIINEALALQAQLAAIADGEAS